MIKIDMEMPKSCFECDFVFDHVDGRTLCFLKEAIVFADDENWKPLWCPLFECEDEKSCDTCKHIKKTTIDITCDQYFCDEHSHWDKK